jgi:hypothetical protein
VEPLTCGISSTTHEERQRNIYARFLHLSGAEALGEVSLSAAQQTRERLQEAFQLLQVRQVSSFRQGDFKRAPRAKRFSDCPRLAGGAEGIHPSANDRAGDLDPARQAQCFGLRGGKRGLQRNDGGQAAGAALGLGGIGASGALCAKVGLNGLGLRSRRAKRQRYKWSFGYPQER